jgi:pimeloyl-ACP methyl ester carboxylesterase
LIPYHEVAGDGPGVALLHSTVCDSRMWDAEFAALAGRYRVLRLDLRGFGRSPLPPGPFSPVDDVRTALDEAGLEGAALVGASAGAALALDVALDEPERVTGLVLAAPAIGGLEWSDDVRRFGEREDELLDAGDLDGAVELNLRTWVDGPRRGPDAVDPAVRAKVGEMQRRAFEIQVAAYAAADQPGPQHRLHPPAIERLEDVRAPALVIVGDADVPDVLERAEILASRIPGARKVVLPDVAHMVNLERPEEFLALVEDFLADAAR